MHSEEYFLVKWKIVRMLLKDLHYKQLYGELHGLEVRAFFLQFAVVHIHWVELILFIGTQFVPRLWVIFPVPADIWIEQCQAHHIQCCSSTSCSNKYEERNQAGMLLGLPDDLTEHVCGRGLPPRRQENEHGTHTKRLLPGLVVFKNNFIGVKFISILNAPSDVGLFVLFLVVFS